MKTFYSVIGCEEALSQKELKDKYFELIRNVHPDKNPHTDLDSFTVAHKAWSVLRDPLSRAKYDCWLQEQRLREAKQLIGQELTVDSEAEAIEADCRCGGWYEVDRSEIARVVDFALFEYYACRSAMNSSNKVLVLGDSGVGKSTLVNTLCGASNSRPQSTVGCAIQVMSHQYASCTPQESTEIIELWDVGGSSLHRKTAASVFFENVSGVVFTHDLSNSRSEENLVHWSNLLYSRRPVQVGISPPHRVTEVKSFLDLEQSGYLPTLVIGSRLDLAPQRAREQTSSVIRHFLPQHDVVYLDCRKEIPAGSTNRVLLSRFFDAVVDRCRNTENGLSLGPARRRRGL